MKHLFPLKSAMEEIQLFLTQSFLKLNTGKTATTFFGSKYQTSVFDDLCIEYQSNTLPKEPLFKKTRCSPGLQFNNGKAN